MGGDCVFYYRTNTTAKLHKMHYPILIEKKKKNAPTLQIH